MDVSGRLSVGATLLPRLPNSSSNLPEPVHLPTVRNLHRSGRPAVRGQLHNAFLINVNATFLSADL
jgi:hypothetical protein